MDAIIILTAKSIGWLVLLAINLFLILLISRCAWNLYRHIVGWPLATEAIREYRKAHPERFKHFDNTKIS